MINIEKEVLSNGSTKFTMTEETKKVIQKVKLYYSFKHIDLYICTYFPCQHDGRSLCREELSKKGQAS